jgi:hypothetical protein
MIYSREVNHLIERGIKFEATKTGKFKIISFCCFFFISQLMWPPNLLTSELGGQQKQETMVKLEKIKIDKVSYLVRCSLSLAIAIARPEGQKF